MKYKRNDPVQPNKKLAGACRFYGYLDKGEYRMCKVLRSFDPWFAVSDILTMRVADIRPARPPKTQKSKPADSGFFFTPTGEHHARR